MTRMSFRAAAAIGTVALAAAAVSGTTATATPDQVARPSGSTVAAASAVDASADARVSQQAAKHGYKVTTFKMVRSPGIVRANCLPKARARVVITSGGQNEVMKVYASGLPKKTEFDFFVLQVPDFPFGLSWYQGDLKTNKHGARTRSSSAGSMRRPSRSPRVSRRRRWCTIRPPPTRRPIR